MSVDELLELPPDITQAELTKKLILHIAACRPGYRGELDLELSIAQARDAMAQTDALMAKNKPTKTEGGLSFHGTI
jgi:translation elongation factor EF-Ts